MRLIIIGASGHGKVVADIAKHVYKDIAFLDDAPLTECMGYPVIGKSSEFVSCIHNSDFFVAIGDAKIRKKVTEMLEASGAVIATLIHPNAVVADDVVIGEGTVIMAGTVINPGTEIGKSCIINTCSSIDHDCKLLDYVHVAVGSHLAGMVSVGENTWIGAGATVSNNVEIVGNCMVGSGAVVVNDLMEPGTYVGVPAREMNMKNQILESG